MEHLRCLTKLHALAVIYVSRNNELVHVCSVSARPWGVLRGG